MTTPRRSVQTGRQRSPRRQRFRRQYLCSPALFIQPQALMQVKEALQKYVAPPLGALQTWLQTAIASKVYAPEGIKLSCFLYADTADNGISSYHDFDVNEVQAVPEFQGGPECERDSGERTRSCVLCAGRHSPSRLRT